MKKTLAVLLSVVSFSSLAQSLDQTIGAKIERLSRASSQGTIARLSRMEKDELNNLMDRALQVVRDDGRDGRPDDGRRPGPGGWNPGGHGPGPIDWRRDSSWERNQVIAYSDMSCRNLVTEVRQYDDCSRLSTVFGNSAVFSVSINGQCSSINYQQFRGICPNLTALARAQKPRSADLEIFSDMSCRSKVTELDPGIDCGPLGEVLKGKFIFSIKLAGGNCVSVNATSFDSNVCSRYQDGILASYENDGRRRRSEPVELFTGFNCANNSALTTIQRGDNCQALAGLFADKFVFSVRFRGQCVNTQGAQNFQYACQTYAQ